MITSTKHQQLDLHTRAYLCRTIRLIDNLVFGAAWLDDDSLLLGCGCRYSSRYSSGCSIDNLHLQRKTNESECDLLGVASYYSARNTSNNIIPITCKNCQALMGV